MTTPDWIFRGADAAEPDLRAYLAAVAAEVGVGPESATVDLGPPLSAYLAVDHRLPGHPDRDAALLWSERYGWAVAVETHSREDLIIVGHLGAPAVPPPARVARFLADAVRGGGASPQPPPVDPHAARLLAAYRPVPVAS
ncbi:DUF6292 family protein [Actinokineospora guangxiensis]|uniref:DUF6292 family protein n=1 Tax=Actinokineospora guangxiensis TaxID=1490288 RepID=A0ABW0EUL2_9PSEU